MHGFEPARGQPRESPATTLALQRATRIYRSEIGAGRTLKSRGCRNLSMRGGEIAEFEGGSRPRCCAPDSTSAAQKVTSRDTWKVSACEAPAATDATFEDVFGAAEVRPLRAPRAPASVTAVKLCAQAVDLLHDAAGMTAVQSGHALERCWRDIHTMTQHVILGSTRFEVIGRIFLGLDPGSPII